MQIRIGLSMGESTVQDADYFGMPTIEAARLCDRSPADGILASLTVRMLAGRCDGIRFESVGALDLKGIPDPMDAFAVLWAPLDDESADSVARGRWPLPSMLQSVPPISYVGRERERARIEQSREAVRGGARQVVLLAGEPGIGKTRLGVHSAHAAHAEGFAVCWGGCSEELAAPYQPWIEACAHLVEHAPEDLLASYVERHGGELCRLGRELGRRVPGVPAPQCSDPETERFLLFSAVAGLLQTFAEAVPICLVLDDLHWADAESLALLKHLARTVERGALLVVVTYRDSDLTREHPLTHVLADLRRVQGVERIALSGLGAEEVAAVLSAAAGHELDEHGVALATEIAAETGGNPFFVGEILRHLTESGMLVLDEASGRWKIDRSKRTGLPQSVRDVIDRRVERLGESAREVLTTAAVIGRSFDVDLLARLVHVDEATLLDQLDAAVVASVLSESPEEVGRFSFAHALINEALYEALGPTRRARMHQRVALELEELCGEDPGDRVGELARHWAAGTQPARADKAIDYARRAAERALDQLAPDEAVRWFTQALELLDGRTESDEELRCELLIGLGDAGRQAGVSFRRILLDASRRALALNDVNRLVRAVLANNRGRTSSLARVDEQRIELLETAIDRVGPNETAVRARLLSLLALEFAWDPDYERRRSLSDEALELARTCGDQQALAHVLRDRPYTIWAPTALAERRANVDELLELAEQLDDPVVRYWARVNDMDVCGEAGDVSGARAALEQCTRIAARVGQPTLQWSAALQAQSLVVLGGAPDEVQAGAEWCLALGTESGQPDALLAANAQLVYACWCRGDWDEAISMAEATVPHFPKVALAHSALGAMYAEAGRLDDARRKLVEAWRRELERLPRDTSTMLTLGFYTITAAGLGDQAAADVLSEQLATACGPLVWQSQSSQGAIDVYRGMLAATLGRDDEADARLTAGIELNDRIGAPVWATRGQLFWAEQLARRGDQASDDRARQLFGAARAAAKSLGATALLERAEAGLARAVSTSAD